MFNQPLKGIKVIDFCTHGAGPSCCKMLADWGADVYKVEPLSGEAGRFTSKVLGMRADSGENPHCELINANKRSIPIHLKTLEGKEIMDKLLANADVFVSNYRLRALEKLGLGWDDIHSKYPRMIWAVLTGFGTEGPCASNAGFDTVAYWARSGALLDFCEDGAMPLTPPFALGDLQAGVTLAGGVAAAIVNQMRTGIGEKVMTSLYAQGLWANAAVFQATQHKNDWPKSRLQPDSPLRNTYRCKDGVWLMVSVVIYDRYFAVVCDMIGCPELINDSRFNTEISAKENAREFVDILDRAFSQKTYEEWAELLTENDVAFGRINHIADAASDKQAWVNGYIYNYTTREGNKDLVVGTPVKFGESVPAPHKNAPLMGEHTVEIMKELGYSDAEIEKCLQAGATMIMPEDPAARV